MLKLSDPSLDLVFTTFHSQRLADRFPHQWPPVRCLLRHEPDPVGRGLVSGDSVHLVGRRLAHVVRHQRAPDLLGRLLRLQATRH